METKKIKNYHRISEFHSQVLERQSKPFEKGMGTGFHSLDQILSFPRGTCTTIYAPPSVGKSVITLDILMALAEQGKVISVYSPEFTTKEELAVALVQAKIPKVMYGEKRQDVSDKEFIEALDFVSEKFILITKSRGKGADKMSIGNIINSVKLAESEYGVKVDILFIDPFNYVERSQEQNSMTTQDYVLDFYDSMVYGAGFLNIHIILSAHTRDVELLKCKTTGIKYYDIPHPSDIMSGQSHYRGGYNIVAYWRQPAGVIDENGIPYPENVTDIIVQKAKPFGAAKLGKVSLHFDDLKHSMFEVIDGKRFYRNEYQELQNLNTPTNNMPVSELF